jgi:hypothetical protein
MKTHQIIALAVVTIIVCISAYYILSEKTKDGENKGLTGTFEYTASGEYDNGSMRYEGFWTLSFEDGKIVENSKEVTHRETGTIVIGPPSFPNVPGYRAEGTTDAGLKDPMIEQNAFLKGSHKCGTEKVSTIDGTKTLEIYTHELGYVFIDDSGKVYRIETEDKGETIVFNLVSER